VHKDEDLNAAHAETAEVTRSWKELRGKYDGLKRKWESKVDILAFVFGARSSSF
jgi:hypothetical protein